MNKKEIINLLLSKVAEDKKEAFVEELRAAKTREERVEIAKKYNVTLTEEEAKAFKEAKSNKISDEELDEAAGGCGVGCGCGCYCNCGY